MRRSVALGFLAICLSLASFAETPIPGFASLVTDQTGTLSVGQQAVLENKLRQFEARRGSQIAVLIVETTSPESVEQFSLRVAERWKPGRKKADDGVLLLVAKKDRKVRIEVGYGLEAVLPDAVAAQILSEEIMPRFRRNDFAGGITAGIDRIVYVIEGGRVVRPAPPPQPVAERRSRDYSSTGVSPETILLIFIATSVMLALIAAYGAVRRPRRRNGGDWGGGDGGGGYSSGGNSAHGGSFGGGGGGLFGGGGASGAWGDGGGGDGGGGGGDGGD